MGNLSRLLPRYYCYQIILREVAALSRRNNGRHVCRRDVGVTEMAYRRFCCPLRAETGLADDFEEILRKIVKKMAKSLVVSEIIRTFAT